MIRSLRCGATGRGPRFRGRPKPRLAAGWLGRAPTVHRPRSRTSARGLTSLPQLCRSSVGLALCRAALSGTSVGLLCRSSRALSRVVSLPSVPLPRHIGLGLGLARFGIGLGLGLAHSHPSDPNPNPNPNLNPNPNPNRNPKPNPDQGMSMAQLNSMLEQLPTNPTMLQAWG